MHERLLNGSSWRYRRICWQDACVKPDERLADYRLAMGPETPLDAQRILDVLARHEVEYVIVGGLAVQAHGHVRTTVDVDVFPCPERENLARLADALNALGAKVLDPGGEGLKIDATMLPRATLWQFDTPHGAIDVLNDAPGAPPYRKLSERALRLSLGDLQLAVAGRDDLIGMKRASARPADLEDIAALAELGES